MTTRPFLFGALLFLLAACASSSKIVHTPLGNRTALFPNGTYVHDVTLKITATGEEHHFTGGIQITDRELRAVGLGFLGATAFRVVEDRKTGSIDVKIYYEPMKQYEPRLRQFFGHLHTLLNLPAKGPAANIKRLRDDRAGFPLEVETEGLEKKTRIRFLSYDENQIPDRMTIERPEFSVDIKVTSYDL